MNQKNTRIYSLNGLKIIATLCIVIYHYAHFNTSDLPYKNYLNPIYIYGHFCVDLFFVISGFLFFNSFSDKIENSSITLVSFIKSRIYKLWPLFIFTTLIVGLEQWILIKLTGKSFIHSADLFSLFLNIVGLQHVGLGYELGFNGPAWYISILLLTYIVSFLICKYTKLISPYKYLYIGILGFLISFTIQRCGLSIPFLTVQVCRGFTSFYIGCIIYYFYSKGFSRSLVNLNRFVLCFSLILGLVFKGSSFDIFGDRFYYWVLVISPALIIVNIDSKILNKIFSINIFNTLDKLSYSIYLWHFPIEIAIILFGNLFNLTFNFSSLLIWWVRLTITILFSIFSYFKIEPICKKYFIKLINT